MAGVAPKLLLRIKNYVYYHGLPYFDSSSAHEYTPKMALTENTTQAVFACSCSYIIQIRLVIAVNVDKKTC